MAKITVKDTEITVIKIDSSDYISLTDVANAKEGEARAAGISKRSFTWIKPALPKFRKYCLKH